MGFFDWLFGRVPSRPIHSETVPQALEGTIDGPGDFAIEAVGESKYQRNIESIAGGKTEEGHEKIVDAVLFLEDSNPHDNQAVQVQIRGKVCGYLSRQEARQYRAALKRAGHPTLNATVKAMIVGGWDRGDSDTGHFGVRLDLPHEE